MSNGYLVAAETDLAAAHGIGAGFGLEVIDAGAIGDPDAVGAALAAAANVGLVLSAAAGRNGAYVSLLQTLSQQLRQAQLILVEPDARAAFAFLPTSWPVMSMADARERARLFAQQSKPPAPEPEHAHPLQPIETAPTEPELTDLEAPAEPEEKQQDEVVEAAPEAPDERDADPDTAADFESAEEPAPIESDAPSEAATIEPESGEPQDATDEVLASDEEAHEAPAEDGALHDVRAPEEDARESSGDEGALLGGVEPETPAPEEAAHEEAAQEGGEADDALLGGPEPASPPKEDEPAAEPPPRAEPPMPPAYYPPPSAPAPIPPPPASSTASLSGRERYSERASSGDTFAAGRAAAGPQASPQSAPADATAFAPKKLRRGEPELIQVAIHQPSDLKAVIKAARKADSSTDSAPQSMGIGDVALGATIGVALEARGAIVDGDIQRRVWTGAPIFFPFAAEADGDAKQIVFVARIFINDAQIGMIAFKRGVRGPAKQPASQGEEARMKRHKRVFLSYSSQDRETVAVIATAYEMAGVPHFWDRAGLKGGETWSPRLRREIDKADLFHLCWSKAAAQSEWVEKETTHALKRSRSSWSKTPNVTVQMLDGPPWAPHPDSLDSINFDDFKRAAIVGYARGED